MRSNASKTERMEKWGTNEITIKAPCGKYGRVVEID